MMTVLVSIVIITMRREFVQIFIHLWKMTNNEGPMTKKLFTIRSVAVLGHSHTRQLQVFHNSMRSQLTEVAAPGDGRTPAASVCRFRKHARVIFSPHLIQNHYRQQQRQINDGRQKQLPGAHKGQFRPSEAELPQKLDGEPQITRA